MPRFLPSLTLPVRALPGGGPAAARRPRRGAVSLQLCGLLGLALAAAAPLRSQDLVGCQLVDGTLQCVPGVTADPQQQIRILEGRISRDQQLEGAIQQNIDGLQQLVLQGQALEGEVLQVALTADALAALPPSSFHWYRRAPGRLRWELISSASGPSYKLGRQDIAYQLMVVVAVPSGTSSRRQMSPPVGPVRAIPAASAPAAP
ncbi:MAG: hypothetical protein VKI83_07755 [Synechococcaceae cyanobacterium]|nr:hypothetical protein [Synechococcaceae cyanobacterium]